ncbi:MAG: very short patch repair endonuclease [Planctomycetota bacterium]|nr:very short patch repair endonuclease [Planctomycetota bacterium]
MPDDRSPAQRSETMRRVRSRDTSPERLLRSALHRRGMRYSLSRKLPGKPDIIFTRARVAVFVDGCFWHGCPDHCRRPSSNTDYWLAKIDRNIARDRRVTAELKSLGWRVIRLWEHQVAQSPTQCAARIERTVTARQ